MWQQEALFPNLLRYLEVLEIRNVRVWGSGCARNNSPCSVPNWISESGVFFLFKYLIEYELIALLTKISNDLTEALSALFRLLLEHVPEPVQFRIGVGCQGHDKCSATRTISVLHGVGRVHNARDIFQPMTQCAGPLQEL